MTTIQFEDGTKVNFEGDPTPQDVEEVANNLKIGPHANPINPIENSPSPKLSLLQKSSNFIEGANLPGSEIGKNIGEKLAPLITPAPARRFLSQTPATTPGKYLGDIGDIGLTLGTLGLNTEGRLVSGVIGAGLGAAGSIKKGESLPQIAKSTGLGFGLGLATPTLSQGINASLGGLENLLPKKIAQSILSQSKKELLAGKDLSETLLNKPINTLEGLIKNSHQQVVDLSKEVAGNLTSDVTQKLRISNNDVFDLVANKINNEGGKVTREEVKNIVSDLAPQAKGLIEKNNSTLLEANRLRSKIDETLGDRGFLSQQLPFKKNVLRDFTNILRETVKQKAPEGTRSLFDELSKNIGIRDALLEKSATLSRGRLITFKDLISAGLGSKFGFLLGGGIPGAIAGVGVERALGSTPVELGTAKTSRFLGKIGQGIAGSKPVQRILKTSFLRGANQ